MGQNPQQQRGKKKAAIFGIRGEQEQFTAKHGDRDALGKKSRKK